MGLNHTVMNSGWVAAHQRTHESPSLHERDPLMWDIELFRFIIVELEMKIILSALTEMTVLKT